MKWYIRLVFAVVNLRV